MAAVDLIDDFQVARQQMSEQVHRPALQSFWEDGVVGVGAGAHADVPSLDTSKKNNNIKINIVPLYFFFVSDAGGKLTKPKMVMSQSKHSVLLTVSQSSFSSSTRTLISSGMAMAGWVSFSWMAT